MSAARCRPKDPIREAASLLGREPWDSTRAQLLEGEAVSVLMSSRRDPAGTSDVSVTLIAKAGPLDEGEPVSVTLAGAESSHTGRLDARGCCVIHGVPDGRYRVDLGRVPELDRYAAVLLLPMD